MDMLYKIISEIKKHKRNIISEKSITIQFNYFNGLKSLLNYEDIKNIFEEIEYLNNSFLNVVSLYICIEENNEIDIFDYIDDKDEYRDEVLNNIIDKYQYKLIVDKNKLCKHIVNNNNMSTIMCLDEDELISKLNLGQLNYSELEKNIFKTEKNIILIIDSDIYLFNNSILFLGFNNVNLQAIINDFNNSVVYKNREEEIQLRNTVCNWTDSTKRLVPNDLFFDFNNNFRCSQQVMNNLFRIQVELVIMFISNFTGCIDGNVKSVINSNKRIEIKYSSVNSCTIDSYKNFNRIYKWIYNGKSFSDKLNICRNVIGAIVAAKCQGDELNVIVNNSDRILKSLNDNLEEFTKGNIKEYFDKKEKISSEILKDIDGIKDKISVLIKVFINGMTSLLGISIAGVVGYIAKGDIKLVKILAILYIFQLDINILLQIPINIVNYIDINKDFNIKKEKYINIYFGDDDVVIYEKRKKRDTTLLIAYIIFTLIVVIGVHYLIYKIVFVESFVTWILSKL
ncbi:hypothetical protein [uncultured Clostridium sp.]|uniref:hypothetical protein n=1 Tax=uncultured Clostridium sp. TaxID=59620 RepID=UPI0025E61C85|nr:hypothetical protein [uncultured Clostridium sp.]